MTAKKGHIPIDDRTINAIEATIEPAIDHLCARGQIPIDIGERLDITREDISDYFGLVP